MTVERWTNDFMLGPVGQLYIDHDSFSLNRTLMESFIFIYS